MNSVEFVKLDDTHVHVDDEKKKINSYDQSQYASSFSQPVVIVTQPDDDLKRVPELFDADAKNWILFCALGCFAGWCTACNLGMKYQVYSTNRSCNFLFSASM